MSKALVWALVIALIATIIGYVVLKVEHVDGAETMAIAMSAIIGVFVGIQNSLIAKDLEKVKNQTNGMTHHIMEENKVLRRVVEPALIVNDREERTKKNARKSRDPGKRTGQSPRNRSVSDRRDGGGSNPERGKEQTR